MFMTYIVTVTAVGPRGGIRGSDTYRLTDEDFETKWAVSFKNLIEVMALRAVEGKSAWPLPTDDENN